MWAWEFSAGGTFYAERESFSSVRWPLRLRWVQPFPSTDRKNTSVSVSNKDQARHTLAVSLLRAINMAELDHFLSHGSYLPWGRHNSSVEWGLYGTRVESGSVTILILRPFISQEVPIFYPGGCFV